MSEPATPTTDDDDAAGIAGALIKARNERGLTQAQLAELTGVSRSAIKGYETGKNMPGSRELKALCSTLGISPTALLYGSDKAFADRIEGLAAEAHPAEEGRARWQLFALTKLLPPEEVSALLQLARAIVVARQGVDVASAQLAAGANAAIGLAEPRRTALQTDLERMVAALDAEDEALHGELKSFMEEWETRKHTKLRQAQKGPQKTS